MTRPVAVVTGILTATFGGILRDLLAGEPSVLLRPEIYVTAALTGAAAYTALIEGRTILDLAEGLQLRRVRVMGANRIELTGFTDAMRDRLRVYGLFSEIISWKLRFFVPVDATGPEIIGKLLDRFPIERIGEREAA